MTGRFLNRIGIASLVFWLFLLVIAANPKTAFAADNESQSAATAFAEKCAYSVLHRAATKGFSLTETLSINGNVNYPVVTYRSRTSHPDTQTISVWIGKGHDGNLEIPRIMAVCLDGDKDPDMNADGDIIFYSKKGHPVALSFHLLSGLVSTWKVPNGKKVKASDSVWMVDCQGGCGDTDHPTRDSWPTCMTTPKDQNVQVMGPVVSLQMCSNSGATDEYAYEVHMDQVGSDGIGVDIGIDPKIINHPQ